MRIVLFLLLFSLQVINVRAQLINLGNENSILTDVKGEPFIATKFTDVLGTPFLEEEWLKADLLLSTGVVYKNVDIRINAVSQEVHYLSNQSKKELVVNKGLVKEFTLSNGRTYEIFYGKKGEHLICEVLVNGKCKLLKFTKKDVFEEKMFNSAIATKKFQTDSRFYLFRNGELKEVKRQKDILSFLIDQGALLDNYLETSKNKCRTDKDLIEVVNFYNNITIE